MWQTLIVIFVTKFQQPLIFNLIPKQHSSPIPLWAQRPIWADAKIDKIVKTVLVLVSPIWADAIPAPPVVDVLVRPFFRGTSCLQQKNRIYDYEANLNGFFWNSLASSSSRAFLTLGSWRSAHTRHQNFVFINSPVPFHWNYNYYHGFWNRPEIKVEIYEKAHQWATISRFLSSICFFVFCNHHDFPQKKQEMRSLEKRVEF